MKKLFCGLMVMFCMLTCAMAEEYVGIEALREQAQAGWQKTYQAHGRKVAVDVVFEVPDVQKAPVVRIAQEAPPTALTDSESPTFFNYYGSLRISAMARGLKRRADGTYIMESGVAENAGITRAEAETLVLDEIKKAYPGAEFAHFASVAHSRRYEIISAQNLPEIGDNLDLSKPKTDTGYYEMLFFQTFQGLTYLPIVGGYWSYYNGEYTGEIPLRWHTVSSWVEAYVYTARDYDITANFAKEVETVYEDIPLAPYERVLSAFEEAIEKGWLRRVDRVALMTFPYYDESAADESMLLLPTWVAFGEVLENPDEELPYLWGNYDIRRREMAGSFIAVDAQTGKLLNPFYRDAQTQVAGEILSWADVQK